MPPDRLPAFSFSSPGDVVSAEGKGSGKKTVSVVFLWWPAHPAHCLTQSQFSEGTEVCGGGLPLTKLLHGYSREANYLTVLQCQNQVITSLAYFSGHFTADHGQQCRLEMMCGISWALGDKGRGYNIKLEVAVVAVNTSPSPLSALKVVFNKWVFTRQPCLYPRL